jgi:hypothetical protein
MTLFSLCLFTFSTSFILLSSPPQASFAQPSSSSLPETPLTQEEAEGGNQLGDVEAARQQYLASSLLSRILVICN